jgi:hypothetical protein
MRRKQVRAARRGAAIGAAAASLVPLPGARLAGAAIGGLAGWLAATPAERDGRKPRRGIPSPLALDADDVQQAVEALREARAAGEPLAVALGLPPVVRLRHVPAVRDRDPRLGPYVAALRQALAACAERGSW